MRAHIALVVIVMSLLGLAYQAESQTPLKSITDIYSDLESCDVTVQGSVSGDHLVIDLSRLGTVLQSRTLELDGPGTWIAGWDSFQPEKGSYDICATLVQGEEVLSKKCYSYYYGGQVPVRFEVKDFNANSKGIQLSILSQDPTIVNIYYMLITGDKALYISEDDSLAIASLTPIMLDRPWSQILVDGLEYRGRVKIVEPTHNRTWAFMRTFTASDDAKISETYEDETGASATVVGNSRVPFEGKLRFILSRNGTVLESIDKKTPVLLTDKDETVEISWNETLEPGVYQMQVLLIGKKGDVKDVMESVIDAKPIPKLAPVNQTQASSPFPEAAGIVSLIAAAGLLHWIRRRSD